MKPGQPLEDLLWLVSGVWKTRRGVVKGEWSEYVRCYGRADAMFMAQRTAQRTVIGSDVQAVVTKARVIS